MFAELLLEEVTDKVKIPIIKEMDWVMKYLMNMTAMAAVGLGWADALCGAFIYRWALMFDEQVVDRI